MTGTDARSEAATLLAIVHAAKSPWHVVADLVEQAGSATAAAAGDVDTDDPNDIAVLNEIRTLTRELDVAHWLDVLEQLAVDEPDVRLVSVLDPSYPRNL